MAVDSISHITLEDYYEQVSVLPPSPEQLDEILPGSSTVLQGICRLPSSLGSARILFYRDAEPSSYEGVPFLKAWVLRVNTSSGANRYFIRQTLPDPKGRSSVDIGIVEGYGTGFQERGPTPQETKLAYLAVHQMYINRDSAFHSSARTLNHKLLFDRLLHHRKAV